MSKETTPQEKQLVPVQILKKVKINGGKMIHDFGPGARIQLEKTKAEALAAEGVLKIIY